MLPPLSLQPQRPFRVLETKLLCLPPGTQPVPDEASRRMSPSRALRPSATHKGHSQLARAHATAGQVTHVSSTEPSRGRARHGGTFCQGEP